MIDRISITNQEQYVKPSLKRFGDYYNQSQFANTGTVDSKYRLYRRAINSESDSRSANEHFITISLNSRYNGFKITGNLRKWWFGKNNIISDFDYTNFCACIEHLANRIGVKEDVLWESSISYVEIGASVRLHKKFNDVIASVQSFPRRKRFGNVDETAYFKTQNSDIIVYDKITHIFKESGLSERARDRLHDNMFILRYEIKLRNISNTVLSEEVKTLASVRENWRKLLNHWEDQFHKITLINQMHPPVDNDKGYLKKSEVSNFLIRRGIVALGGIERLRKLVYDNMKTGEKKEAFDFYVEIFNDHNHKEFEAYKKELYEALRTVKYKLMKGLDSGANNIV